MDKLSQQTAEDLYRKAQATRTSFIATLIASGSLTAADLAHTLSGVFGAPLLDIDAIDPLRLTRDLLDNKLSRPTGSWRCTSAATA